MSVKEELYYLKSHEWVEFLDDGTARVGISDHAQNELGDLVFVNLPEVGDNFECGEVFADVESVKAVSDVYLPVSGTVTEINEALLDKPELINEDPYDSWFVTLGELGVREELMNAAEYEQFLESEK